MQSAPSITNKMSSASRITDHFSAILLITRRLHLHEHVLDAVNVWSVLPAPPCRARQRGGLRGGVGASIGCIAQVVGGLLKPGQPRLVGVAVGRGTPQVGVAASTTTATGGPVAPCGWWGLSLHHVWIVRCPLLSSELAGRRTASSWSCSISTPWNTHLRLSCLRPKHPQYHNLKMFQEFKEPKCHNLSKPLLYNSSIHTFCFVGCCLFKYHCGVWLEK